MSAKMTGPFFEIGPKGFLRRTQLELLARAAGNAASDFDVTVILTVPTALIAPIAELNCGVLVFAQTMDPEPLGASMGAVTPESLVDAGADGVMLNHESNPLAPAALEHAVARANDLGLETIVCAGSEEEAVRAARLGPTAVLFEPPALIGTVGDQPRPWIDDANRAIRAANEAVLTMHAGGVSDPGIARSIMASGADGTGSTSGILTADRPITAARDFIAAARAGWDCRHHISTDPLTTHIKERK
ncbi:triose-phosphate isomerase [Gordonia sp. CPCC 205515]|uniref:triose-phosphate isomerase n=1 Tax=Gordonia sp. CPCC 205515 TaxID=3140791 RepID=UPI003AF377BF